MKKVYLFTTCVVSEQEMYNCIQQTDVQYDILSSFTAVNMKWNFFIRFLIYHEKNFYNPFNIKLFFLQVAL